MIDPDTGHLGIVGSSGQISVPGAGVTSFGGWYHPDESPVGPLGLQAPLNDLLVLAPVDPLVYDPILNDLVDPLVYDPITPWPGVPAPLLPYFPHPWEEPEPGPPPLFTPTGPSVTPHLPGGLSLDPFLPAGWKGEFGLEPENLLDPFGSPLNWGIQIEIPTTPPKRRGGPLRPFRMWDLKSGANDSELNP